MRRPLDQYETPPHYVTALTDVIGEPDGTLYEPCVGDGNILDMLDRTRFNSIETNDLDRSIEADTHGDAAVIVPRSAGQKFNWIITNPPFSREQAILENMLRFGWHVVFLARLSFLEPTKTNRDGTAGRLLFWGMNQQYLKDLIVLPRYSFTGEGSDSMTCCWLHFDTRESGFEQKITIASVL